jgi:hypothetical protein
MCKPTEEHLEVAERLETYTDYGNPPGLNDLLVKAAELLRNSRPIEQNSEENS